jgi:hypothetical protein
MHVRNAPWCIAACTESRITLRQGLRCVRHLQVLERLEDLLPHCGRAGSHSLSIPAGRNKGFSAVVARGKGLRGSNRTGGWSAKDVVAPNLGGKEEVLPGDVAFLNCHSDFLFITIELGAI